MKIALTQFDMAWEDKALNKHRAKAEIEAAKKAGCDMVIFPEMTLTGFSMQLSVVAELPGENGYTETMDWFLQQSIEADIVLVFGYVKWMPDKKKAANMLAAVKNGRVLYEYQKIHPFSYAGEDEYYAGGNAVSRFQYKDVIFGGFICYDLRFPEIFQIISEETDAIIVIANWPEERICQWEALLRARAIENQCYILGVNRYGSGDGLTYPKSSMAFDPTGKKIGESKGENTFIQVMVEKEKVRECRNSFPVRQDRREALYRGLRKRTFGIEK